MIGSSTLIVKENNKYGLRFCSAYLGIEIALGLKHLRKKFISYYKFWEATEKSWRMEGKGFDAHIEEQEVNQILKSHHCIEEERNDGRYSKYAGDCIYLLDLDNEKIYHRGGKDGEEKWMEITFEDLERKTFGKVKK